MVERILARAGMLDPAGEWYHCRPVIVSGNHYHLGLFNGDIGVCMADGQGGEMVYFPAAVGGYKAVSPFQMPPCATAFALTVHKSQGSEYRRVALVLPEEHTPLVTRELLYTAVTRSRERFSLWGPPEVWEKGLALQCVRQTGLGRLLSEDG